MNIKEKLEDWYVEYLWLPCHLFVDRLFPWYHPWERRRRTRRDLVEKFGFIPTVGDRVEDCRVQVHTIVKVEDDLDTVVLDDGANCSLMACCDRVED